MWLYYHRDIVLSRAPVSQLPRPHLLPLLPMLGEGEKALILWEFSLPSPDFGRGKGRGWVRANTVF